MTFMSAKPAIKCRIIPRFPVSGTAVAPVARSISGASDVVSWHPQSLSTKAAPSQSDKLVIRDTSGLFFEASLSSLPRSDRNVTSITAGRTFANSDRGVWALGGNALYTATFGVTSGYDADYAVILINTDTGNAKTISLNGTTFLLWPGQQVMVNPVGSAWFKAPASQRWKVPANTTAYFDAANGLDTNDGLTAGTAFKTFGVGFRYIIKDQWDFSGASAYPNPLVRIQLADNGSGGVTANPYDLMHFAFVPVGTEGRCTILIQGNAANPGNTIIAANGGANFGAYGPVTIQLRNLQINATSAGAIESSDGAQVFLQGGIIFGGSPSAVLQASNGGQITVLGDFSTTFTTAGYWAFAYSGGVISCQNRTITFNNSPTFTQQFISALDLSTVDVYGAAWTNGGTVTATKFYVRGNSLLVNGSGTGAGLPGATAGTIASGSQVF